MSLVDTVFVVVGREGDFRWPISAHETREGAVQAMRSEGFENRTQGSTLEVIGVPFRRE